MAWSQIGVSVYLGLMIVSHITFCQGYQNVIETVDSDLREDKSEYSQMKEEVYKAVKVINEIADAIQSQEDIGRYGSLVYSCTGLVGSGFLLAGAWAPFTAGLSLAVTAGGVILEAGSAVVDFIHENVRDYLVDRKLREATEIFESIHKRWGKFNPGTSHSFSRNQYSFYRFQRKCTISYFAYSQNNNFQKSSVSETDTAFQKGEGASNHNMKIIQAYGAVIDAVMDIRKIIQTWKMISDGTVNEKAQYLKEKAEKLKTEMETMFY